MKYVIYLRVSTKKQDFDNQLTRCMQVLRRDDPSNFEYLVFSDKKTAKNALKYRPGITEAICSLRRGDVLVAEKIDRISRNGKAAHTIQADLVEAGVSLKITSQPGISDPLMFAMLVGLAVKETEMISNRTKEQLRIKKERGERTGTVPYGFTLDPNKMVIVNAGLGKKVEKLGVLIEEPYEQTVVAEMLRLFDSGTSLRRLTKILGEKGYLNRKQQPFQYTSVRGILLRLGRTKYQETPQEESEFATFRSLE